MADPANDLERAARRRLRATGQQSFDEIAGPLVDAPEVSRGNMFGSNGLRYRGKFFAFVDGDGQLLVKLPAMTAAELRDAGRATAVRVGRHPAREWVAVPMDGGDEPGWGQLLSAALRNATESHR